MLYTACVEAKRGLDTVTQAETVAPFGKRIVADYACYTAGTAMLETAERLTAEEREPTIRLFLLLVGGLRALSAAEHAPGLVLDSFILRALALSGYEPALSGCARCGTAVEAMWFAPAAGGLVCAEHRLPQSAGVTLADRRLLVALLAGDWPVADAADARSQRDVNGIVAAYLQWQLERGLRSLRLVERT
jgi:DNA repair protein RecO (recombination protein O)